MVEKYKTIADKKVWETGVRHLGRIDKTLNRLIRKLGVTAAFRAVPSDSFYMLMHANAISCYKITYAYLLFYFPGGANTFGSKIDCIEAILPSLT
jgi:hypothetical protein